MAKGRKTGGNKPEGNEWRFWAKVKIRPGCWLWTGSKIKKGYGNFGVRPATGGRNYKVVLAHEYAYEMLIGPIPEGKVLDHIECDNPKCPNPFHVTPTTNRENVLRGRGPCAINARKTHCIHGHEFTPENTMANSLKKSIPGRRCRTCADIIRSRRGCA